MPATEERDSKPQHPKKWQCGDPYQYPIKEEGDPWQKLLEPLLEKDHDQCESWKDEVQNLLIFVSVTIERLVAHVHDPYVAGWSFLRRHHGLRARVVPGLQPDQNEIMINLLARIATRLDNPLNSTSTSLSGPIDPAALAGPIQSSSIRINVFWFISLVLSLTTALISIVSLQWLREHQQYPSTLSSRQKFAMFNMRAEGLKAWYVPQIFSSLPLLLQFALTLFFVGLINFLLEVSSTVAIVVVTFIGIPFAFLIFTTIIPALQAFLFCLPLAGRTHRVPQQAPYKSTQSRLFRHLVTCSEYVFIFCTYLTDAVYRHLFLLPSRLLRFRKTRQGVIKTDEEYDSSFGVLVVGDVFTTLASENWLSYDEDRLAMRDAYAKSIFDKKQRVDYSNMLLSKESPLYDLTTGISTISTNLKSDSPDLRLCYLCVQDTTSLIFGDEDSLHGGANYNRYLQNLLALRPQGDLSHWPFATFSCLLVDPPVEFMRDENNFIFLSGLGRYDLPSSMVWHFSELHARIANCLYSPNSDIIWDPLANLPSYPNMQFRRCYDSSHDSDFEGDISQQFSSVVKTYLEIIADQDLDETALNGRATASILRYAVVRQSSQTVIPTMNFLSTHIKHGLECGLDKKLDFLFYFSSFYAFVLLSPDHYRWGISCSWTPNDDDKPAVAAFLQVLRRYLDVRRTPDVALRQQLGIPDISSWWWEFLNQREDKHDALEDRLKVISSESPTVDTSLATQIGDSLPYYAVVQKTSPNRRDQSDMSKINPDAVNLV